MPKKNNKSSRSGRGNFGRRQVLGNGSGPSKSPSVTMLKKFQYTMTIPLDNATSTYSYVSDYLKPDITKCMGAEVQFAAYELWRLKRLRVSVQNAGTPSTAMSQANLNDVSNTTIWTAADYGANETMTGTQLMQYQNVKKNTLSLNKFVCVVDTDCRINGSVGRSTSDVSDFIYPPGMWINTTVFASHFYSGYQLFAQNFGTYTFQPDQQPSMTVVTELVVEFMQPAFQNNASTFSQRAFGMKMVVQPNSSDPTELRAYVFNWYKVHTNSEGVREFSIHLVREDGEPGSLTYNGPELLEAIRSGTSGKYFNGRRATYDGPMPPRAIPDHDFTFGDVPTS